jgi:lysophospholipase L1-like esterase
MPQAVSPTVFLFRTDFDMWRIVAICLLLAGCNDSSSSPSNANFAMLGDSIIAMMGQYQPSLPAPFNTATNLGIGGQTSTQIASRIGSAVGSPMLLLEGGINNLNDPDQIVADYTGMLNAIPPTTTIFFLGIIQLDEGPLPVNYAALNLSNAKVNAVDARLNALCATHPNCHVQIAAQTGSMVGLTQDGIHPNQAGYSAIVSRILTGS